MGDGVSQLQTAGTRRAVTRGRATLLITHDLVGLDQVDEIVILDHGRVAARGTHTELLRSTGLYRQMRRRGRFGSSPACGPAHVRAPAPRSSHPYGRCRRGGMAMCWIHDQAGRKTCRTG